MHVPMKKAQVMMAWIGQKVVLSVQLDDGVLVYPVGAVGVLESVSPDGAVIVSMTILLVTWWTLAWMISCLLSSSWRATS